MRKARKKILSGGDKSVHGEFFSAIFLGTSIILVHMKEREREHHAIENCDPPVSVI